MVDNLLVPRGFLPFRYFWIFDSSKINEKKNITKARSLTSGHRKNENSELGLAVWGLLGTLILSLTLLSLKRF